MGKAEGIERRTRLELLKRTWKTSIWSEEDDEEMTLPDPETPLVYSLHYAQESEDWEDELPPETVGGMKKQDKAKSNLRAEEDFSEKVESMNLDPHLTKLIHKYQRCPHPCLVRKSTRWTSHSNQSLKGW